MFTSPKAIAPFHMALGIQSLITDGGPPVRTPDPDHGPRTPDPGYLHSAATCVKLRMLSTRAGAAGFLSSGMRAGLSGLPGRMTAGVTTGSACAIIPVAVMVWPTWSVNF